MKFRILMISMFFALVFLYGCSDVFLKADEAVLENNPALCKELETSDEVNECYGVVAENMKDPKVCFKAVDQNDCVGRYSVSMGDVNYCDLSTDVTAKYACVARVTGDQTGRAVVEIIADWEAGGEKNQCLNKCESTETVCQQSCTNAEINAQSDCNGKYPQNSDERFDCVMTADGDMIGCDNGCAQSKAKCRLDCGQYK